LSIMPATARSGARSKKHSSAPSPPALGHPAEGQRRVRRQPGKRLPDRDELSDPECCGTWETGPDGKPRDPWQNTRFVYFVDPTSAEAFTFVTASWGGRQAVNDLAEQIQRMRYARPDASPLVELHAEPWLTKFGRKSKPFFKVINWHGGEPHRHGGGPRSRGSTPASVEPRTITSSSMDDEIAF
jgi:hypothetical protein